MEKDSNSLTIDVSGTKFKATRDLFLKYPSTRLGRLLSEEHKTYNESENIFYQRSPSSFEAILTYYQTGKLHIPSQLCPKSFKTELDFWQIETDNLDQCCFHKFLVFRSNNEIMNTFRAHDARDDGENNNTNVKNTWTRVLRRRIWSVISNGEKSMCAKIYHVVAAVIVLMSLVCIALSTLPTFQYAPLDCSGRDLYLGRYKSTIQYDALIEFLNKLPCDDITNEAFGDYLEYWDGYYGLPGNGSVADEFLEFLKALKLPSIIQRPLVLTCIEYFCTAFFTVEFFISILTCPCYKKYFCSAITVVEILAQLSAYAYVIVDDFIIRYRLATKEVEILQYMQMLRALRLFRVIQDVTAVRVLGYSLRHRYNDILVLVMFLFVGVLIFANIMYFAEDRADFPSIPDTWWWCVITMTTVGYGDMTPKTVTGKIIGSICALSGIVLLSLVIPIFSNTYMSLYQFANLEKENKLKEEAIKRKKNKSRKNKQKSNMYTISHPRKVVQEKRTIIRV